MHKVIITLRDNSTGNYLKVPVTPESIAYTDGDAMTNTVKILGLGNVNFREGVDLDSISWSSFFPARYDSAYCTHDKIHEPLVYRNLFSSWKDAGTSLQIICEAAGMNKTMTLDNFNWELKGFEGDVYYTAAFKEHKEIKPRQIAVTTAIDGTIIIGSNKPTAADRPDLPNIGRPSSYTTVDGDTLIIVAKKLNIGDWHTIYDMNRDKIGDDPYYVKPGQVLYI